MTCFSCRKELKVDDLSTRGSIPLASTRLSLKDFVEPENYQTTDDGRINLVYDLKLYDSYPIQELSIPDREDYYKVSLETIKLSNTALKSEVTLGDAYPITRVLKGQTAKLPALNILDAATLPIDANTFFESALLEGGKMYVKITNDFPVEITYMKFRLSNASDKSLVAEMELTNILPGETAIDSADMTGVFAEGNMVGELLEVNTKESDVDVLIDPDDAVKIEVSVKDLVAFEARAVFPAQDLINHDVTFEYDFNGPEILEMKVKSGKLVIRAESNIDETIYVKYEIPGVTLNGDTVIEYFEIPPSSDANPFSETKELSLAGYDAILRGKRGEGWLEFNQIHNRLIARIDSTGKLKDISKNDSITLYVALKELVPEYVLGYFGQDTIKIGPNKEDISAFRKLEGGMEIDDVSMALSIYNSAGLDANLNFEEITSQNNDQEKVTLSSPELGNSLYVGEATDPKTPFTSNILFDKNNSNSNEFVENLPQSILYAMSVELNPRGNDNNRSDFVYEDSRISASVLLDIPMTIKPKDVILSDTVSLSFSGFSQMESLDGLDLNLIVYNGYPFSADIAFILLSEDDEPIDTLFGDSTYAQPGLVPNFESVSTVPSKTVFNSVISRSDLDKYDRVTKAVIRAQFTSLSTKPFVLYDSYEIEVKLTTDLKYVQKFD